MHKPCHFSSVFIVTLSQNWPSESQEDNKLTSTLMSHRDLIQTLTLALFFLQIFNPQLCYLFQDALIYSNPVTLISVLVNWGLF